MKQYSIKTGSVEEAMELLDKLGFAVSAWQLNWVQGKEDMELAFRTEKNSVEVVQLLLDYNRLGTLSQDF